jgi:hypothetical protein
MRKLSIYLFIASLVATSCNKQIDSIKPLTKIDAEGELSTLGGIQEATVGNYILLANSGEPMLNIGEGRGNNVTLQQFAQDAKQTDAYYFVNSNNPALGYSVRIVIAVIFNCSTVKC